MLAYSQGMPLHIMEQPPSFFALAYRVSVKKHPKLIPTKLHVPYVHLYLSNGAVVSDQSNFKIFSPCPVMYFPCTCMGSNLECPIHKNFIKFCTGLLMYRLGSIKFTVSEQINFHFQICMPCSGGHLGYPFDQHIYTKLNAKKNLY